METTQIYIVNLNNLCRVCLSESNDMYNLYSPNGFDTELLELYVRISSCKVNRENGLPFNLCGICYSRLKECYIFRQQCLKSFELFQKILQPEEPPKIDAIQSETDVVENSILEIKLDEQVKATSIAYGTCRIEDAINATETAFSRTEDSICRTTCKIENAICRTEDAVCGIDSLCKTEDNICRNEDRICKAIDKVENIVCKVENSICALEDYSNNTTVTKCIPEECKNKNNLPKQELKNEVKHTINQETGYENHTFHGIDIGDVEDDISDDPSYKSEEKLVDQMQRKKSKQALRLQQFSYDEVHKAIEESKLTTNENTRCIKCDFDASTSRALAGHMTHIHKETKGRWCSTCNLEFDDLETHSKTHKDVNLKCKFCGKICNAKGHLTEHLRSHLGVRPYKCNQCNKTFISSRHLRVHYRVHSNERPYQCKLCPKTYTQLSCLKAHLKQHENDILCSKCSGRFTTKQLFSDHKCDEYVPFKREEYNPEPKGEPITEERLALKDKSTLIVQNFCIECNRKVRSLQVHNKTVHGKSEGIESTTSCDNKKLCTYCGKQFKTGSKLKVHMRIHTGEAPYKCAYCYKKMTTRTQLIVHERIHTGEKPHACGVCGKAFAQTSVLNTHMKLHTGRPELCKICGQRFCRPAELRLHMRKHTGEKPYMCTECGQAFIQRSHLMEHLKTHSDERPYQCSYCDRAFKQNSSLKSHVQIHLGYKPYRCSQCSYACRQSYSLTQHMKQHANDAPRSDRPHMCTICNKGFTTMAMLICHNSAMHSSTLNTNLETA